MIETCGQIKYDVRSKACDKCGHQSFVRPKDESWECCAGVKPYNPSNSICCQGSLSDLSSTHRDAKEARCCGTSGFFADVETCWSGMENCVSLSRM